MSPRPPVKDPQSVVKDFDAFYHKKLQEKGPGIFYSSHEILGVLSEEVAEFEREVHVNNKDAQIQELFDIAVVAMHGIASLKSGKME